MNKNFVKIIQSAFSDRYYREYLRLLFLYWNVQRYKSREIKFLKYHVTVPDCPSFIYQFKEIFVKQYYAFSTESKTPVIYDCGANIGISVIFFKTIYRNSRIKAFEADKRIAGILENNLERNGIKDVEIYRKAVWTDNNGVEFYSDEADAGTIYGRGQKILIDSVRLKDFIDKEQEIDFLKLDIEGAEQDVIEDMRSALGKVKNLFIEYHSFINREQKLDNILLILRENGFRYFINSVYDKNKPFKNKINKQNPEMDLQLNIFAYK